MALKPIYVVDGRRWMPEARARQLLATSPAGLKRMMGDGSLEWIQNPRGLALLVLEDDVLKLRLERRVVAKEIATRSAAPLRTADERKQSMRVVNHASNKPRSSRGALPLERTWDPSPLPLPISGRDPDKRHKP